ncbi:hypothetical protein GX586_05970 [bacterium]|nr:hypothetical protein [bacterium]
MKRFVTVITLCAAVCLTASADVFTWTSTANGNWDDPANWQSVSGGYPQQPGDVASFTNIGLPSTTTLTITLPAGAVTCGVVTCSHVSNSFAFNGASANTSFLVLTNVGDVARIQVTQPRASSGGLFAFRNCTIEFTHPALLQAHLASLVFFESSSAWQGDTVVTGRGSSTVQYLRIACPSPNFTGTLVVDQYDAYFRATPAAITNARLVKTVRGTGAYIENRQAPTFFPLKLENGTRYHLTSNGAGSHDGPLTAEGAVAIEADSTLTLSADVSGTGTVAMTGSTAGTGIARFTGSISPGASVGVLGFNENAGVLELGTAADALDLNIEITGAGGEAGVDHDQIVIQNLDTALNLANLNVAFSGTAPGNVTNWFLVGNSIDTASDFASVDYGPGRTGAIFKEDGFDGVNDRVGAIVVPEPAAIGVALCAVVLCRRMRA